MYNFTTQGGDIFYISINFRGWCVILQHGVVTSAHRVVTYFTSVLNFTTQCGDIFYISINFRGWCVILQHGVVTYFTSAFISEDGVYILQHGVV